MELSKRQIAAFVLGLALAAGGTIWLTNFIIARYVIGERDDPLTRAGGLKPSQSPNN
jgi:hypothetical protein